MLRTIEKDLMVDHVYTFRDPDYDFNKYSDVRHSALRGCYFQYKGLNVHNKYVFKAISFKPGHAVSIVYDKKEFTDELFNTYWSPTSKYEVNAWITRHEDYLEHLKLMLSEVKSIVNSLEDTDLTAYVFESKEEADLFFTK